MNTVVRAHPGRSPHVIHCTTGSIERRPMMSVLDRLRTSAVLVGICVFGDGHAQTPGLLDVFDQVWDGVRLYSYAGKPLQQGAVGGGDSLPDVIIGAPGVGRWYPPCESGAVHKGNHARAHLRTFGGPRDRDASI